MIYTHVIRRSWSGYNDELGWAAAWLFKATQETKYKSDAISFFNPSVPTEFSWDNKNAGHHVLLYDITRDNKYKTAVNNIVDQILNKSKYTPKGLIFIQNWGSLRHAGNLAHLCLQVRKWAR